MWNEDYRDMLCALRDADVDFILVGAYALAAHGLPRATLDIDLWVRPSPVNARKICRALAAFGAPAAQISAADFEREEMVVQIGVAPRRIDFVTSISGVAYEEAARNAVEREIDGIRLRILSVQDFIRNKIACGRPKDIADAELLRQRIQ
jgi:predicted nucleotidyltransferase